MKLSLLACVGASMMAVATAEPTSGSVGFTIGYNDSVCSSSQIDAIQKALNSADVIDVCGADPVSTWGEVADLPICNDKNCLDYITPIIESLPSCTVDGATVKDAFDAIAEVCDYAEENGSPPTDGFRRALGVAALASFVALQAIL